MLRPTEQEVQDAEALGIDHDGMSGPQIREAIHRARVRQNPRKTSRRVVTSAEELQYIELCNVATDLGLVVPEGIAMTKLKDIVETKLVEIFQEKGFAEESVIQYTYSNPQYNKTARIVRIGIVWKQEMPHVYLHMENKGRPYLYHAYHAALYATVIG